MTTTDPTALVSVRVRTEQSGLLCPSGTNPQFSLYVDGYKRAIWSLAPGAAYTTFTIDVDAIGTYAVDPGTHTLGVSLDNDQAGGIPPCDRNLYVDSLTLTTRPSQLFAGTNWRSTPLAPDAPVLLDRGPVDRLQAQVATFKTYVNDGDSFSVPVYTVRADQPRSTVTLDPRIPPKYTGADLTEWNNQMSSVPIPANAKASGPCDGQSDGETYTGCGSRNWSDREIAIYQPATDTLWEIYHLVKHDGNWVATDGGRITNVSQDANVTYDYQPFPSGKYHGVAAARIPLLATLQRTREVMTNQINHPVSIHIPHVMGPDTESAIFTVPPALANDGDFQTADAIREGTRFRLPASYDLNRLQDPYLRAFAKAVRDYGMIVTDKDCHNDGSSCAAVTTIVQDPAPAHGTTDPYGIDETHVLDAFEWDQLEVLAPTG